VCVCVNVVWFVLFSFLSGDIDGFKEQRVPI